MPRPRPLGLARLILVAALPALSACSGAKATSSAANDAKHRAGSRCSDAGSALRPVGTAEIGSAVALGRLDGKTFAFVADEDDRALHVVDIDAKRRLSSLELGGRPKQLLVAGDGRILLTNADTSELVALNFDGSQLVPRCAVDLPAEPVSLAWSRVRGEIVVVSRWAHTLSALDAETLKPHLSVQLARDPSAVALSQDGRRAFVSHVAGGVASVVDLDQPGAPPSTVPLLSAADARVSAQLEATRKSIESLPAGPQRDQALRDIEKTFEQTFGRLRRTAVQGFALAKSSVDERIFMPQVFVDPGQGERRTGGYGTGTGASELVSIAVIDTVSGDAFTPSLESRQQQTWQQVEANEDPCLLPRAAAVDEKSGRLFVACAGIDSVIAYDASSAQPVAAETRRWRVAAGPSGVAVDPEHRRLVVWSQFDPTISTIDLGETKIEVRLGKHTEKPSAELRIEPSGDNRLDPSIMLGRLLFHATGDNRISQDGRACASCHPSGRDDGLTWSTPNGPRRTRMLGGMLEGTAPYSWDGQTKDLDDHLSEAFTRLGGSGRISSLERRALVAYIQALPAPPRGHGSKSSLSDPTIARGRALFESAKAGCASCHGGGKLTNNGAHDVSSRVEADRDPRFDTPSLKFLSGRGPYFHDGRYKTLRDLVDDSKDKMGKTSHLGASERDALLQYLRSL